MLPHTRSRDSLFACALALGVLLLLPAVAAAVVPKDGGPLPGTNTLITTDSSAQSPAISGSLISFIKLHSPGSDVCYYDLSTSVETKIATSSSVSLSDVSDGVIAYVASGDLFVYDTASGQTTNLTASTDLDAGTPSIGDGLVVWSTGSHPGMYDPGECGCDLATGEVRDLPCWPGCRTDGRIVVANNYYTLLAYDWGSATSRRLCDMAYQSRPDVSGDRVVFATQPDVGVLDIGCYDLATDTLRLLELPGNQIDPRISGDYVVFCDGTPDTQLYVCLWDMATDTVYRIPTPLPGDSYWQLFYEGQLDIDGHRLVYPNGGIHAFEFDVRPPTITVNSPAQDAVYTKFAKPVADWSAVDDYSGVASSGGTLASGQPLDMTPGTHTVTFWATDGFGNKASIDRTYTVKVVGLTLFPAPGATLPLGDVTVGQAVTQIVTATNSGEVPLWISAATTHATPAAFSVSGGAALLNPGQTLDLTVRFAPTATGVLTGALHVEGGDATSHAAYPLGLADIGLTGRGVSAELPPQKAAQKLLLDYNAAIANGTLVGSGPETLAAGRVKAMRFMIEATGDYIARGNKPMARILLTLVIGCCDGLPPDFVSGPARQQICDEARALLKSIGR